MLLGRGFFRARRGRAIGSAVLGGWRGSSRSVGVVLELGSDGRDMVIFTSGLFCRESSTDCENWTGLLLEVGVSGLQDQLVVVDVRTPRIHAAMHQAMLWSCRRPSC